MIDDDTRPEPPAQKPEDSPPAKNPAKKIGLVVLTILVAIMGWYALTDRYTPSTSRGFVMANVVRIAPRVSGQVNKVDVVDNAIVDVDAPLFEVDRLPFELAVQQAKAQLQQAHQSLEASSAQLLASQANVAQARAALENAHTVYERTEALQKRGLVPQAQVENARASFDNAEAAVAAALAQLDAAQRQIGVVGDDNPQIRAAQLQLEQTNYDLLSTVVRAPFAGLVTNLSLSVGQFIGAGSPAMTLIDADGYWITAELRENQLVNVDPGDSVDILFDAIPGSIYQGRVDSVAWGINPGLTEADGLPVNRPVTQWFEPARRIPVRITLDKAVADWPQKVRVGGKVGVMIHAESRSTPVSLLSGLLFRLGSFTTALY
jgi:multidrug resistance efflux pump